MRFLKPWLMARFTMSGEPSANAREDEPASPSTVRLGIRRGDQEVERRNTCRLMRVGVVRGAQEKEKAIPLSQVLLTEGSDLV